MNHLMNLIHLNNTRKLLGQTCHKIEALSIPQLDCWQVSPLNVFIRWDIFSSGHRPNIVPVTSTCMKQDTDQLRPVRKSRHPWYISQHRQHQIYTKLFRYQKITQTHRGIELFQDFSRRKSSKINTTVFDAISNCKHCGVLIELHVLRDLKRFRVNLVECTSFNFPLVA